MNDMKHDFNRLLSFLEKLPAIDLPSGRDSIGYGQNSDGLWWVKFALKCDHKLAWRHVQEFGFVLNYISVSERLPTVFMPISPPPYLNGGIEFLSWVIESKEPAFTPYDCCIALEGRLPNPIDDISQWIECDRSIDANCNDETGPPVELTKYFPRDANKDVDCESTGKRHHWYNCDDVHSGCYNCGKIVIGTLWKRQSALNAPGKTQHTTAMQTLARIIGALALLAITGFCVFGFMASYEYSEATKRLPWQIGYGALGLICLSGAAMVLRPRRRSSTPKRTNTSR